MITDDKTVLAKPDGTSLMTHTRDALCVFRRLREALPMLPEVSGKKNFFDLLFFSVYLHDWGKAHQEFQKRLRGETTRLWLNSRHEFYSVPFADMLPLEPEEILMVARTILGHHKNYEDLLRHLYTDADIEAYQKNLPGDEVNPLDFKANFRKKLDFVYLRKLKDALGLFYQEYIGKPFDKDFRPIKPPAVHPVQVYAVPFLQEKTEPETPGYWAQMLLSGAEKLCDHIGSAGITEIPTLTPEHFDFLKQFHGKWYHHQKICGETEGNLLMTAPTGSGKTEAALLWMRRQLQASGQGRIFYVLPYTASINAMHARLVRYFEKEKDPGNSEYIGLLHGKLGQYLAQYFEDKDKDPRRFSAHLSKLKDLHKKMIHPLKVVTPFQILKYCYGVRGYDMGFAQMAGAMFVFDEIHAYDMRTYAQIVTSLNWLIKHLNVRVMIMTATLPCFMIEELQEAIGVSDVVRAQKELSESFTRHQVRLVDGGIFDCTEMILNALDEGQKVILVCNTVKNAQRMFEQLTENAPSLRVGLIHGRFTGEDRMAKERLIHEGAVTLLVGTQVIEVSLDIDFDVLFSEPAPLDALIQRFGRINRKATKGICPVYVCREPGEMDHYIYPPDIVARTLDVLENVTILKETELQDMLDQVYPAYEDQEKYDAIKNGFLTSLKRLRPFMPTKEQESEFYKQFTGVPVLPAQFQEKYETYCYQSDFIRAEQLFVNLHIGMFHKLLNLDLLEKLAAVSFKGRRLTEIPYWIAKCRYSQRLGLLDEEESRSGVNTDVF